MSTTNSSKPAKKSILETDLSQIQLSKLLPKKSPQQMAMILMLSLSSVSLILSLIYLVITGMRINQTNIPPLEGQLLNRTSIEKAAQLLREETVVFSPQ